MSVGFFAGMSYNKINNELFAINVSPIIAKGSFFICVKGVIFLVSNPRKAVDEKFCTDHGDQLFRLSEPPDDLIHLPVLY